MSAVRALQRVRLLTPALAYLAGPLREALPR